MHITERAPVLSATSSTVCIWIISSSPTSPADRGQSWSPSGQVLGPFWAAPPGAPCPHRAGAKKRGIIAACGAGLQASHCFRAPHELRHPPALGPRDRPALLDRDEIARLALVRLVVRVVLLGARHDLAVERVGDPALHAHRHGLVHLVAHHPSGELAAALGPGVLGLGHLALAFSASTVRTRAMSRRTFFSWLVFESCWVAFCIRRLNCALSSACSSVLSAPVSWARSSFAFMPHPNCRWTNVVLRGSLAAASANASRATGSSTPSISKSTLPGWISATKNSGLPLPLPIRTSAGFCETGLSGNTRIQIRAPRLTWRVIARRPASIWRAVSRPRVVAFRPYSPKLTLVPPVATP